MECNFQIFLDGEWVHCATLSLRQDAGGSFFEYDLDYAFSGGQDAVSLQFPVNAELRTLPNLPPFFYDLIPQGRGRKFLLGMLKLLDGPLADFPLVMAGAFNPIGRVRVAEAVAYFDQHVLRHKDLRGHHGLTLEQITSRGEAFHEQMMIHSMLAAGTTGVQGAAPKYLLTKDRQGAWHADGALTDEQAAAHFIVKRPRGNTAQDQKVLKNERAYMEVAGLMGLRTHGLLEQIGDSLFIPRFDRVANHGTVIRHHQESAASLAGLIGFDIRPSQFDILAAIRSHVTDKPGETIEFLKRDVLNLAMRNTDNHARNTAVQKIGAEIRLTPLFDFAPMYLDPEGITRAARWYHPVSQKELSTWTEVLQTLNVSEPERTRITEEMHTFGARLQELEHYMRQAGVDDDVIDFLLPSVDEQSRQLLSLGN
jgi:serine/threonine-protein kinase HipA